MHEEVVVEDVEQLPAMELYGVDQKESVIGSRQGRLYSTCRRPSSIPSKIIGRTVVVKICFGERIAENFTVGES